MEPTMDDVSVVIRLVREVSDLWDDPRAWREHLLHGACRLLNGHVGLMLADYQPEAGWFGVGPNVATKCGAGKSRVNARDH